MDRAPSDWKLILPLMLILLMFMTEGILVYAAVPVFYKAFNEPHLVGWLLSGYYLVGAIASALGGALGDMFGRRRVLIWLMVITLAGGIIAGSASTLLWVVIGHAIQGAGIAIAAMLIGLIRQHALPSRLPFHIAVLLAARQGTVAALVVASGWLVDNYGWRWVFWGGNMGMALGIAFALMFVPKSPPMRAVARIDWSGSVWFTLGLGLLLIALTLGEHSGWGGIGPIASAVCGIALLFSWARRELKQSDPLIDIRLFKNRNMALGFGTLLANGAGLAQTVPVIMVALQAPAEAGFGLAMTATAAGAALLPSSVGVLISGPLSGAIAARVGVRNVLMMAAGLNIFTWLLFASSYDQFWILLTATFLFGFSLGALLPAQTTLIVEAAPRARASEAAGMTETVRSIGSSIGAQLVAIMLATSTVQLSGSGRYPTESAFELVAAYVIGLVFMILICALFIKQSRQRTAAKGDLVPEGTGHG